MDKERIDEIRQRAEAATPGPYRVATEEDYWPIAIFGGSEHAEHVWVLTDGKTVRGSDLVDAWEDATFYAKAIEDIPDLIAALQEAQARVEALEKAVEEWRSWYKEERART